VRGLFKDAIIASPDRRSTNASTDGILCCQKEATFNLKDEKSRIVPYFSQLILQTSGKGLVSPITTARHDPETRFETISFSVNDHTERGTGGRQYGTSEKDKQTLTGENNTSAPDLGQSKKNRMAMPLMNLSVGTVPSRAWPLTVVLSFVIDSFSNRKTAPSTINVRLAAVRRLAHEAADTGLLSPELAAGISRVKGAKRLGVRIGNWLTVEQSRT
jgi:hypothetical protein